MKSTVLTSTPTSPAAASISPSSAVSTRHIELFTADNDTIVPPDNTRRLADALGGRLHVIPNGGHFLDREGFTELPPVLRTVEAVAGRLKAQLQ